MLRISILAHKCRGEDQKKEKRSSARNLRLRLGVHTCFCPGTRLYSRLGRTRGILGGGDRPRNALQRYQACYFLLGTFLACRAQAVIWEARPRNAPHGAGPGSILKRVRVQTKDIVPPSLFRDRRINMQKNPAFNQSIYGSNIC